MAAKSRCCLFYKSERYYTAVLYKDAKVMENDSGESEEGEVEMHGIMEAWRHGGVRAWVYWKAQQDILISYE